MNIFLILIIIFLLAIPITIAVVLIRLLWSSTAGKIILFCLLAILVLSIFYVRSIFHNFMENVEFTSFSSSHVYQQNQPQIFIPTDTVITEEFMFESPDSVIIR
ncbi:MAG: hypothetical protein R3Y38_01930 [Rikenellaceae bacterium]